MQHNLGVFILFHIMVMCVHLIPKHATEPALVNNCSTLVHSTASCDKITYEQVYDTLTKSENSFNIESALYPPKRPSSVRVHVNVYSPNETNHSTPAAKYTWSISSLYAAIPVRVLEFWSLGAIQVTRRTQKLNITISISCCDVTKGTLKKHIEDALAALEDLAIKPTLRDPRLNSAECVMEGHESDIIGTGHGDRIIAVLVCSFIFSVLSGAFLAFFMWQNWRKQTNVVQKTMDFVCASLLVSVIFVYIGRLIVVYGYEEEKVPLGIEVIQPLIAICGFIIFCITYCKCFNRKEQKKEAIRLIVYIVCANLVAYHFCWLAVGIMLNPLWGVFHLFGICLFVGVFSYYVYQHNYSIRTNDNRCILLRQTFYWSLCCIIATACLLTVLVLTGQSYNGKETADEVFKDVLQYLIPICFAWFCWRNRDVITVTTVTAPPPDPDRNPLTA